MSSRSYFTTPHPTPDLPDRITRAGRAFFPLRILAGGAAIILGAFIVHPAHSYGAPGALRLGASLLLLLSGLSLRAWAAASNGGHTRTDSIEAPWLATGGPYAHVRNPIYLGTFILGLGMIGAIGDARLLMPHLIVFAFFFSIVRAEEDFLTRKFGHEYESYRAFVPRFLPSLAPWPQTKRRRLVWSAARGELLIALALALIYLTFRLLSHIRMSS